MVTNNSYKVINKIYKPKTCCQNYIKIYLNVKRLSGFLHLNRLITLLSLKNVIYFHLKYRYNSHD